MSLKDNKLNAPKSGIRIESAISVTPDALGKNIESTVEKTADKGVDKGMER